MTLRKGTAIATFDKDGKYANKVTGNHAAIYLIQDNNGLWVYDQWVSQGAVKKRYIGFRGGKVVRAMTVTRFQLLIECLTAIPG